MFSDHNGIKLEVSNKNMTGIFPNTYKFKNTHLNK